MDTGICGTPLFRRTLYVVRIDSDGPHAIAPALLGQGAHVFHPIRLVGDLQPNHVGRL